jgi:type III secretion protein J
MDRAVVRAGVVRAALAILAAALLSACSAKVELMTAVPEAEANEALAALLNAGIPAERIAGKEGMVGLRVDGTQVARAVDVLRAQGLPRERHAGMGDVFKKEGLISSPLEERARYLYALSQELSGTLSRIDGVITARVHVVLPERSPTGDQTSPASAAVFIKHREQANLDTVQPQIRRLVTNSIPNLSADRVSLILVPSAPPPNLDAPRTESVFGIAVDPAAAGNVRGLVVTLVVLLLAALSGVAFLLWRLVLLRRAPPAGVAG